MSNQLQELSEEARDRATRILNAAPRNAILDAAMYKALFEYAQTGDQAEYDRACKAAFAAYGDAEDALWEQVYQEVPELRDRQD